jgi:MFS family permease
MAVTFAVFLAWRISGGVAIGLASNLSPMYIAEVAPEGMRGRLVSMTRSRGSRLPVGFPSLGIPLGAGWRLADREGRWLNARTERRFAKQNCVNSVNPVSFRQC